MNTKEQIVALIKSQQSPDLDDVCRLDDADYSIVCFLIKVLTGQETEAIRDPTSKILTFVGSTGTVFLKILQNSSGKWCGDGELAQSLNALLTAIRIHEVESYEWVYLPPEIRQSLISSKAQEAGVSVQELKRLMNIWTV